jgi:hypothetical protein
MHNISQYLMKLLIGVMTIFELFLLVMSASFALHQAVVTSGGEMLVDVFGFLVYGWVLMPYCLITFGILWYKLHAMKHQQSQPITAVLTLAVAVVTLIGYAQSSDGLSQILNLLMIPGGLLVIGLFGFPLLKKLPTLPLQTHTTPS